jgi:O-antigen/teichoic acid export membrane protein
MARDVLLITATRVVAVLLMLATSVCISRTLGPEGQGLYFLAMMFCATQVQLSNLGLHNSHTYLLAGNRAALAELIGNTLLASTVVAACVSLVGLGVWWGLGWADAGTIVPLLLGAAIVPARLFFNLGTSLLVALHRIRSFNAYLLQSNAFVLIAVACVSLWRPSVTAYLIATWCGATLCSLLLYRRLFREGGRRRDIRLPAMTAAVRIGFHSYVVCLLTFLVTRLNVFFLEQLSGAQAVGIYSIVAQMMDVLLLIPSSLGTILFPKLVQDPAQHSRLTWQSLRTMTLLMLGCIGVMWLLAGPAIHLVFGPAYAAAVDIVVPVSPAILCCALVNVIQPYFNAKGFPRFMISYWLAGLAVLTVASFLLIPRYGERGAAWALSAAYAAVFTSFAVTFVRWELTRRQESAAPQRPEPVSDHWLDAA